MRDIYIETQTHRERERISLLSRISITHTIVTNLIPNPHQTIPCRTGFLSSYKGRQLGTIGDFGCFSFHYTKNVICGEGGAISVNRSSSLARRALVLWEKGTNRFMICYADCSLLLDEV